MIYFFIDRWRIRMVHFDNDYTEGAHEKIFERFIETNMIQTAGYGFDEYSNKARDYIKQATKTENIDVHFLSGGTQTNLIVIAASLRPYEGVITADSGHIQTLETGAIEAIGHKLLLLPNKDGKITATQVQKLCEDYWNNKAKMHQVQPGMVYLSNPTETGTLYSKNELIHLSKICKEYEMKLFVDGARLGYGLVAEKNDLTLQDLTRLTDVYYIGGTKIGALFGEAVVVTNNEIKRGFRSIVKQKGGLLAKGRALGIQFEVLFENDLYFELSKHAVNLAMKLKNTFEELGIPLKYEAYTNQLFPILPNKTLKNLQEKYIFLEMNQEDADHTLVRICMTWATKEENVNALISDIYKLMKE